MKYTKILESTPHTVGIYENCHDAIYIRADRQRMRIEWDSVQWQGNTGGYHRKKMYIDGYDTVARKLRRIEELKAENVAMNLEPNNAWLWQKLIGNA